MIDLFLVFWTVMIFTSIAWYGFLLFYVGYKGGREIKELTQTLQRGAKSERERSQ